MDKTEFLNQLRASLSGRMDAEEVTDNLRYYEEYINGQLRLGRSEAEVMTSLGSPRLIARSIADAMKVKERYEDTADSDDRQTGSWGSWRQTRQQTNQEGSWRQTRQQTTQEGSWQQAGQQTRWNQANQEGSWQQAGQQTRWNQASQEGGWQQAGWKEAEGQTWRQRAGWRQPKTHMEPDAFRQNDFHARSSIPWLTKFFTFPKWLRMTIGFAAFAAFLIVFFWILKFLFPIIMLGMISLFLVKLFRDWLN